MDPTLTALLAALGMPATTDVNGAIARVHGLVATSASARADLDRIATAAGLAAGAGPTAIAAAVSAEPDPKAWVPMATYTAAASALTELQGKTVEQEAVAAIEKAMGEGKVPPVMRDHYLKVYRFDPAGWPAMASVMPVIVPRTRRRVGQRQAAGQDRRRPRRGEKAVFAMLASIPPPPPRPKPNWGGDVMTALTAPRTTRARSGALLSLAVAAATKIQAGSLVCANAAGYAVKGAATAGLLALGRAEQTIDNSTGAAGDVVIEIRPGHFVWENAAGGDAVTRADIGRHAWIVDDQTVGRAPSASRSAAGIVIDVTDDGVWVKSGRRCRRRVITSSRWRSPA